MNTWLHHPGFEYSEFIRSWNKNWREGGVFHRSKPDAGLLPLLSGGMIGPEVFIPAIQEGKDLGLEGRAAEDYKGFSAPYRGLPDEGYNAMRRFPLSIPPG